MIARVQLWSLIFLILSSQVIAYDFTQVINKINSHSSVGKATVHVGLANGNVFSYSKGGSSDSTNYELASATKWFSGVAIMKLVQNGQLRLTDRPQQFLSYWTTSTYNNKSKITLEQLLSFQSGFRGADGMVMCVMSSYSSIQSCANDIYWYYFSSTPGTEFYYSSTHLEIAAAMAERATGKSWNTLVREAVPDISFSWKSSHNLPAGGMITNASNYSKFLRGLMNNAYITQGLKDTMHSQRTAHLPFGNSIGQSPISGRNAYSLSNWKWCPTATSTYWPSTCNGRTAYSESIGMYGFYPYINWDKGYYVVIATQDAWSFSPAVELKAQLDPLIRSALGV